MIWFMARWPLYIHFYLRVSLLLAGVLVINIYFYMQKIGVYKTVLGIVIIKSTTKTVKIRIFKVLVGIIEICLYLQTFWDFFHKQYYETLKSYNRPWPHKKIMLIYLISYARTMYTHLTFSNTKILVLFYHHFSSHTFLRIILSM